jgi:hypothetical protein
MPVSSRATRAECLLVLVEDGQLGVFAQIVLDVPVEIEDRDGFARLGIAIASPGHPVADVIGKEFQPFMKPPLVQEPGFAIEELLHLTDGLFTHGSLLPANLRASFEPSFHPS